MFNRGMLKKSMSIEQKLERSILTFKDNLKTLRAGRASSALVENLEVEVYESKMPLNQVASISIPQSNQILITPWDPGILPAIERAIRNSDLKLNPFSEGNSVRLTIPPLTEETRRELTREVAKYAEEARISVRNVREEAVKEISEGEASEDEQFRKEKEVQNLIEDYNKKIKEMQENKDAEMLDN